MFDLYGKIYIVLVALWQKRYVIVAATVIMPLLAFIIAIRAPKVYLASATLMVNETTKVNPYLRNMMVSIPIDQRIGGLTALLHSEPILVRAAQSFNLFEPGMSARKRKFILTQLSEQLELHKLDNNTIRVEYRSSDSEHSVERLRVMVSIFTDSLRKLSSSSLVESEKYLKTQLQLKKQQLEGAKLELSQFKADNADVLPALHTSNVQRLRRLKDQLATQRNKLVGAETELKKQQQLLILMNPTLARLEEQIIQHQFNLAMLRNNQSSKGSLIGAKLRELDRLINQRNQMIQEAKKTNLNELHKRHKQATLAQIPLQGLQQTALFDQVEALQRADGSFLELKREVSSISQQIKSIEPSVQVHGKVEKRLNELEQDVKVKRDLYQELQGHYAMTQGMRDLGRHLANEQIKIIDFPAQPVHVAGLSLLTYLLSGLIAGIALGIGLALLFEFLDTTIRHREQLEKLAGVSVLARISKLGKKEDG